VLVQFAQWMRQHRGVSERTLCIYESVLRRFLQAHGEDVRRIGAMALRTFVVQQASQGADSAKRAATALRMFVRYLIAEGRCEAGLDAAIPTAARWRLSALPRGLPISDVERIVAACDPRTLTGARDRAIILLLSRLGLRAGDVVALCVDDLDWEHGRLHVTGKGRRQSQLPLPQDVGDAILHYLRHFRPSVACCQVFLRTRAPIKHLTSEAVTQIVARAMGRASVRSRHRGAHVLRHSAATAMLRNGASLDSIASVLRHRSIETTMLYAKVDVALLREVAQPWPETVSC
jgi:site-specific recombinase XerD